MDLTTSYLGLTLRNPIIASASPLCAELHMLRRLEDAGAAAVVLPSLFEEQLRHEAVLTDKMTNVGAESSPEATSYFSAAVTYNAGPERYLDLIARTRAALDIPVIASLNGSTVAGWVDHARLIEQAGASALELNIYRIVSGATTTGREAEAECVALVRAVRGCIAIPLAVKLHPHFSAFGELAYALDGAGADGLVLFNRLYQPDIDLVRLRWHNDVALSSPRETRLGLLWLSMLSGRLPHASLAASTGVEDAEEVIRYLLAGADAVMTTSALLRHGPEHLRGMLKRLRDWMEARDFASVAAMRGLLRDRHPDAEAQQRHDYVDTLTGYRGPYVSGDVGGAWPAT
ncbi:dihydroorotate dehydrogenase-like protein [Paeniroseomonas aquatica]|uniref:Dihydroorotate dehydrogenase-like protein n=1 Tax=Paeniroseomonas aquatica TaxID=373043 RepID=A0ABT8A3N5_9PROT|nr:dihydroorotate dehydrogenase-like protein [Paeniroseomonas aquatica]MDN3564148.1 dihydroorotate dehydrogenase-like protein [Paeniroseomonas aquatica]